MASATPPPTSTRPSTSLAERTPAQLFALVSAGVYLSAGVIGFFVTGLDPFIGLTDAKVVILAVNPLHNIVHLLLGAVWLAAANNPTTARQVNGLLGAGLLAAFVIGIVGAGEFLNIDGVAEPDNWLHLAWGGASLAFARRT